MIDIGTHSIDAAMFIMNNYDVESVTGSVYKKLADTAMATNEMGSWTPEQFTTEDSAMGYVKFRNGCTMVVEASWLLNTVESGALTMCGTKGGFDMKDGVRVNGERDNKLFIDTIHGKSSMRDLFKDEDLNAEQYDMKQWIHCIENDLQPLVKPEEALVVSEIIEAIYKSAKTGKTIYFPKK
ncbi:MAG: oxidoreductase [Clostridia bacterium]|nr:oxidoreductase [Clostridia bacterium]